MFTGPLLYSCKWATIYVSIQQYTLHWSSITVLWVNRMDTNYSTHMIRYIFAVITCFCCLLMILLDYRKVRFSHLFQICSEKKVLRDIYISKHECFFFFLCLAFEWSEFSGWLIFFLGKLLKFLWSVWVYDTCKIIYCTLWCL